MAVLRQENWLGQQRVDVPMLRAVESAVAADFDTVVGRIMTAQQAVVVRGFQLANFGSGTLATAVQLAVADSILANINATQSGTFLWVPANRPVEVLDPALNARVSGSWTAGQTNFVGLDLTRDAATSTSDLVEFKNPNTNLEVAKEVPLARVLDYKIVITTTPFSAQPNLVPVAKVVTNSTNQVTSVTDARNMLFRLASGGDNPTNATNGYSWPQGRAQSTLLNAFVGGDRSIASMRDLVQALETRIWEIGGGEDWYSPTADRNVFMTNTGTTTPLADYFTWDGTNLLWIGLRFTFDNANYGGVFYNVVNDQTTALSGTTNLLDGECIYVDLDRTSNATLTVPQKVAIQTLGVGPVPGSRQVIAVRRGSDVFTRGSRNPVGVPVPPATTTTLGIVKLGQTSETPLSPAVANFGPDHAISFTATGVGSSSGRAFNVLGGPSTGATAGGVGIWGQGGVAAGTGQSGHGVVGVGAAAGAGAAGNGVVGLTTDASYAQIVAGVAGFGGATTDVGVAGVANGAAVNGSAGAGVVGFGAGTAPGVYGEGNTSGNPRGVWGQGGNSGEGGYFIGGPSAGIGIYGAGGTGAGGYGAFIASGSGARAGLVATAHGGADDTVSTAAVLAFGGSNISVAGISTSGNTAGGYFQGHGSGPGIIAFAGTGNAIEGSGGGISCDNAYDFHYSANVTRHRIYTALEFKDAANYDTSSYGNSLHTTGGTYKPNYLQYDNAGTFDYTISEQAGDGMTISCPLHGIPEGATLTQIAVYGEQGVGGSNGLDFALEDLTYAGVNTRYTQPGNTFPVLGSPGLVVFNMSIAVPDGHTFVFNMATISPGAIRQTIVFGIRVTYTHTQLRPGT
jgi:hypothetical protein